MPRKAFFNNNVTFSINNVNKGKEIINPVKKVYYLVKH